MRAVESDSFIIKLWKMVRHRRDSASSRDLWVQHTGGGGLLPLSAVVFSLSS